MSAKQAVSARAWRTRIFGLTWLSYLSYYFTRKNYSVIKSSLGLTSSQLTIIETVYTSAYAVGQFVNGALADVVGPRRLIAVGMFSSAALVRSTVLRCEAASSCVRSAWAFSVAPTRSSSAARACVSSSRAACLPAALA